jgi:tetratricopeptide (TPR) repeat protein
MTKNKKNIFNDHDCLSMDRMMDYVHDRLSPKERNSIERHLQGCGFCEEAMEGFLLMEGKEDKAELIVAEINHEIGGKAEDGKIRWMMAASFAVAILAGGLLYLNSELNKGIEGSGVSSLKDTAQMSLEISSEESKDEADSLWEILVNNAEIKKEDKISLGNNNAPKDIVRAPEVHSDAYMIKEEESRLEKKAAGKAFEVQPETSGKDSIPVNGNVISNLTPVTESSKAVINKKNEVKADDKKLDYLSSSKNKTKMKKAVSNESKSMLSEGEKAEMMTDDVEDLPKVKDGISSYHKKNYQEAVLLLEEDLKAKPDSADALYYNGMSHFELKNFDRAILNFEKIQKSSRYYEDAQQMRAKAYLAKGDKVKAKSVLQEIINTGGKHKAWAEQEMKKMM